MFYWIELPAIVGGLIPEYTIPERKRLKNGKYSQIRPEQIVIQNEEDYELLFPELWATQTGPKASKMYTGTPLQNLLYREVITDRKTFLQEYMLQPIALKNALNIEHLRSYSFLPKGYKNDFDWVIMMDQASTLDRRTSNVSSIALVGKPRNISAYYIHDIVYGWWTSLGKMEQLEKFYLKNREELGINDYALPVHIEVGSNMDFYNRVAEESTLIHPNELYPKERGDKLERIKHNFGHELDDGHVYLYESSRNKKRLQDEIMAFPGMHPDVLDSVDHAIYLLRAEIIDDANWIGI